MYLMTQDMRSAINDFKNWYFGKGYKIKQVFKQGGFAGTGKTTLLKYIIDTYDFNPTNSLVMAFTGQACNVLRSKGIYANTIHSSLMHIVEEYVRKNGEIVKIKGIPITTERYIPIESLPSSIRIIFIDEGSFVTSDLLKLAKKFNIPIYMTGDPLQLPPVNGEECFKMEELDNILNTPMRHGKDSEIFDLATRIRNCDPIDFSSYKKDVLFVKGKSTVNKTFDRYLDFFKYSQMIICTTNKQRQIINDLYREKIIKTDSKYPIKGEKLICRRNNRRLKIGDYFLTNGTSGICMSTVSRSMIDSSKSLYYMDFKPDYIDDEYFENLICDSEFLQTPITSDKKINKYNIGNKMEFGYATTVHLSQGSQSDVVTYIDGYSGSNIDYNMRIRYTAVTRSKKKLIYIL